MWGSWFFWKKKETYHYRVFTTSQAFQSHFHLIAFLRRASFVSVFTTPEGPGTQAECLLKVTKLEFELGSGLLCLTGDSRPLFFFP